MLKVSTLPLCLLVTVLMHATVSAENAPPLKTQSQENLTLQTIPAGPGGARTHVASKAVREASNECGVTTLQYRVEGVAYSVTSGGCPENQKPVGQTASIRNR